MKTLWLLLGAFVIPAFAQFEQAWVNRTAFIPPTYNLDHGAVASQVFVDGTVLVLMRPDGASGEIYKLNPLGALVWRTNHALLSVPTAMAVDADGNAYVAANTGTAGSNVLAKITFHGEFEWIIPTLSTDIVRVGPNGDLYTASPSDWGYIITRFHADGSEVWKSAEMPGTYLGFPTDLEVDGAGFVYATSMEFITTQFDTTGALVWWARDAALDSTGPSLLIPQGYDLALDALGNVYATGSTGSATNYNDIVTVKYASNGQTVWTARYDGPEHGYDDAVALAIDSAGNTYVAGMGNGYDLLLIKYGSDGHQEWVSRYAPVPDSIDYPVAIKIDPSGDILVFGSSNGIGSRADLVLIRVNSKGYRTAVVRLAGLGEAVDYALGFGLDTNGSVYFIGNSFGLDDSGTRTEPTNTFVVTARYNPVATPGAPRITSPPSHQLIREGGKATFTVKAEGDKPLRYQWRRNGVTLPGETNASLRIKTVSAYTAGGYSIEVANEAGSVSSPEFYLQMISTRAPVVSIRALKRFAREPNPDSIKVDYAQFLVRLSRPAYSGLRINFRITGTATDGLDYILLPDSQPGSNDTNAVRYLDVPAGARFVRVGVYPYADDEMEESETIVASLEPSPDYRLNPHRAASTVFLRPPR